MGIAGSQSSDTSIKAVPIGNAPVERRGRTATERRHAWCDPSRPPRQAWVFDELKNSYNFPHTSNRIELFIDFVAELANEARAARGGEVRGLDIGCGVGIGQLPQATQSVSRCFDELWGLEPDVAAVPAEGAFKQIVPGTLETATLPENYFDAAYSFMVMEHVENPEAFLRAVSRTLRPGGSYVFLTVNGWHYFTLISNTLRALKIDELILRALIGKRGVESYHYPTQYRCNSPKQIRKVCRAAGLEEPEFVFVERGGPMGYLRGPLDGIRRVMDAKRSLLASRGCLLDLICRVRKPF